MDGLPDSCRLDALAYSHSRWETPPLRQGHSPPVFAHARFDQHCHRGHVRQHDATETNRTSTHALEERARTLFWHFYSITQRLCLREFRLSPFFPYLRGLHRRSLYHFPCFLPAQRLEAVPGCR